MKAFRIVEWGHPAEFVDVPTPMPGPGEVLVRMKGAGLCRSDLDIMDQTLGQEPYAAVLEPGFTLGHENAGIVEALGAGVTDLREGDHVVVHHRRICGFCDFCLHGAERICSTFARGSIPITRGVGMDGGLAEFLLVPRHELLSIGTLDPALMAPLTDAGVVSYRAVQSILNKLYPGTSAVVIGVGGLGVYGIQFLKLLSPAKIFAIDIDPSRLAAAKRLGADHAVSSDGRTAETIMDLTNGRGAEVIIDFVGSNATLALAARISRANGRIVMVGMEGGSLNVGWGTMATTCEFAISMCSNREDLAAVCDLAANGKLVIDIERFAFDEVETAYQSLRDGALSGRAVITF